MRSGSSLRRRRSCTPRTGRPWLPFQQWARKAEPVHVSPLGVLIHPDYGLWHSYRGALCFDTRLLPCPSLTGAAEPVRLLYRQALP